MVGTERLVEIMLATAAVMVVLEVVRRLGAVVAAVLVDIAAMVAMLPHFLDLLDLEVEVAAAQGTQTQVQMLANVKVAVEAA